MLLITLLIISIHTEPVAETGSVLFESTVIESVIEPDTAENIEIDTSESVVTDAVTIRAAGSDAGYPEESAPEPYVEPDMESIDDVERILSEMTTEEKIYQMFVLTPEQLTGVGRVTSAGERTRESLEKYPVGGLIYLGVNILDPKQTKDMLAATQAYGTEIEGMPLFLCVDEEGGRIARVAGNSSFNVPKIKAMAEISDAGEAYDAGNTIGEYLSDLGFNVDFAPDCDVLTNPENTVIGNRSFGDDAEVVCEYSGEYLDGLHNNDILGVYKHFPGHGATSGDTHKGFAKTEKDLNEMMDVELLPFMEAQSAGADMVMVSHISVPSILGDETPCSLSHYMVTEVLRNMLGYEGLIITDAMNMSAITANYTYEEAAVMAINAGVDMILDPGDFKSYYKAILKAVSKGEISEDRIDDSVRRIISKKLSASE